MSNNDNAAPSVQEQLMDQAQVFASAWAMVGGPFDQGGQLEQAETEKAALEEMVDQMMEHAYSGREQLLDAFEVLTKWHAKRIGELDTLEQACKPGVRVQFGEGGDDNIELNEDSALGMRLGVITALQLFRKLPVTMHRNEVSEGHG